MGNREKGPQAKRLLVAFAGLISGQWHSDLCAKERPHDPCQRPSVGSAIPEPEDLRSRNGELTVDLTIHNYVEADGSSRYCYTTADGKESPNLRHNPGDLLILNLKNDLTDPGGEAHVAGHHHVAAGAKESMDPCTSGLMTAT